MIGLVKMLWFSIIGGSVFVDKKKARRMLSRGVVRGETMCLCIDKGGAI